MLNSKVIFPSRKIIWSYLLATRPQFIFAYFMISLGGLVIGRVQDMPHIGTGALALSLATVIVAAIGVHYRDEASDWDRGYDKVSGGMGVIRNGRLTSSELRRWGIFFNIIAFGLIIYQTVFNYDLLIVAVPASIVIIWPNFLTEEVRLGHEFFSAFSYWATLLWIYIGQGWELTLPTAIFSVFVFLMAFAIIPFQDIGDYDVDKKSGKKTLAVSLGIDGVGHFSIFLILFSLLFLYATLLTLS